MNQFGQFRKFEMNQAADLRNEGGGPVEEPADGELVLLLLVALAESLLHVAHRPPQRYSLASGYCLLIFNISFSGDRPPQR